MLVLVSVWFLVLRVGVCEKGVLFDLSDCMILFIRAGLAGGRWEGREPWVQCLTC